MSDERYAPPAASVNDVDAPRAAMPRPPEVTLAVVLFALSLVLEWPSVWLDLEYERSQGVLIGYVIFAVLLYGILGWVLVNLSRGAAWAWVTELFLTVLAVVVAIWVPLEPIRPESDVEPILHWINWGVSGIATVASAVCAPCTLPPRDFCLESRERE